MIYGNINVHLRTADGKNEAPVGKKVHLGGQPIFHVHVDKAWQRRDNQSWGLSRAILGWMKEQRTKDVYLYYRPEDATYYAPVAKIELYGVEQRGSVYGPSVNLPIGEWKRTSGKNIGNARVPWVDADVRVVIVVGAQPAREDEPAAPGYTAIPNSVIRPDSHLPESAKAPAQLGLFDAARERVA